MSENTKLLGHDALTGITEFMHFSDDGDEFTIQTVQDVEPIIEFNKKVLNGWGNHARWGDGKLVASIPLSIYYDWKREGVIDDQAALKKRLNDPQNAFMRTFAGRL